MIEQEESVYPYNTLEVDDEGFVTGSAHSYERDGYTVAVGVFSYTYERHGETMMNHVPNVVVSNQNGNIVAEPHAHDSPNPKRAIENALKTGEYVFEQLSEFIQ